MYSVTFQSDNGKKFVFGKDGGNVFDMDLGSGISTNLTTSQGFSQVGETVQAQSVSGRSITVNGAIYKNIVDIKSKMRSILTPLTSGELLFENKYYTRVFVKNAPTFSSVKNDGRFSMQFYAPYPFFFKKSGETVEIGKIIPRFKFPVNYAIPHKFGERSSDKYINILNNGDVEVPFSVILQSFAESTNIVLTNLRTFKTLKINGTLNAGEVLRIYRDNDNILCAMLMADETETDVISRIDESSELFTLDVGDNLISASDDEGGTSLNAIISFNSALVALYES